MLMTNGIENKSSLTKELESLPLDEFVDGNLSTDDDTHSPKGRGSMKAYVESISSDSLIGDVEFIDEDIYDEKDIFLLKAEMSSKDHSEGMGSKVGETQRKTLSPNADPELQSSNELIERIRSVGLKPSKQNHLRASHSFSSSQPTLLHRSDLQSPLSS